MAKHKCKIPDPPLDTTRWMGTYGDMVTLLMAFFVMLFAVSETNNQKFVAFVSGLAGPFDNPALELGLVEGAALEEANISAISLIAPVAGGQADLDLPDIDDGSVGQAQLKEISEDIREVLDQTEVPVVVDVRDDERGLVVSISTDEILFEVGSAELSEIGKQLLGEIAPVLVAAPNTIVVEGHTDNQPLTRPGYSNWNLSTDRAVAVVSILGDDHGMSYDRVSATGFGEHRPLVPNTSDENMSINRRVEILIVGLDVARDGAPAPPPSAEDRADDGMADGAPQSGDPMTAEAPGSGDDFAPPPGEDVTPFEPAASPDPPDGDVETASADVRPDFQAIFGP